MSYGLTVNNDANCWTTTYYPIICAVFVQVILFNYKTIFNCHFLIVEGIVLKLLSVKKYFVYHAGMKFNEKKSYQLWQVIQTFL